MSWEGLSDSGWRSWVGRKEGFFEEVTLAREREEHVKRS